MDQQYNQNEQQPYESISPYEEENSSLLLGLLGGFLGMLAGAVVWGLVGMMGYMHSIIGALMGFAIGWGYNKFRGPKGAPFYIIFILLMIIGVGVGTAIPYIKELYDIWADQIGVYAAKGVTGISFMDYLNVMIPRIFADTEVRGAIVGDFLKGLFFAFLGGIWMISSNSKKEKKQKEANADTNAE